MHYSRTASLSHSSLLSAPHPPSHLRELSLSHQLVTERSYSPPVVLRTHARTHAQRCTLPASLAASKRAVVLDSCLLPPTLGSQLLVWQLSLPALATWETAVYLTDSPTGWECLLFLLSYHVTTAVPLPLCRLPGLCCLAGWLVLDLPESSGSIV